MTSRVKTGERGDAGDVLIIIIALLILFIFFKIDILGFIYSGFLKITAALS